jgi:hypothetical protein
MNLRKGNVTVHDNIHARSNNSLDRSANREAFICETCVIVEAIAARSIRALGA